MNETVEKILERITDRSIKREFIENLVIEIWPLVEEYKEKAANNNQVIEVIFDKICLKLFAHLHRYLDIKEIE